MDGRILLHVDMDAFYAAVEMRDDPRLRGPLVIGADPKGGRGRGVVCTADYAARSYGIHSAQPIGQAYRACPHATFLRPELARYRAASQAVMEVLGRYADVLQVVGLDEAYLDVTEACGGDWDRAGSYARSLQAAVRRATGLSCSVGAAPNRSAAKVASDHRKPHGVTVVPPDALMRFLGPLPVSKLHGCGPRSAARLTEDGVSTVADVRSVARPRLEALLGSHGGWLWDVAHGVDPRPVVAVRGAAKSHGNESTFPVDQPDPVVVHDRAQGLLRELLARQRREGLGWRTLTVKVRYRGFDTLTRGHTFATPLDPDDPAHDILAKECTRALLAPLLDGRPVRLVGVRLSGFDAAGQRSLAGFGVPTRPAVPRPERTCPRPWAPWRGQQVLASPTPS